MSYRTLGIEEKALKVNLDSSIYGSFNEIGAGQEVASNFFRAGASSGTIAWSRSAYDMKVSDIIYGEGTRYVCEERLKTMLDTEYSQLQEMLYEKKDEKRFFAFCNTVEALNYHKTNQGHGWIGLKFQLSPNSEPNEVHMHVKMHETRNIWQQETLGKIGVNLLHACYFNNENQISFLKELGDRLLKLEQIEIDMLRVSGPDFEHFDNRFLALMMVKLGFTGATMFDPEGNVLQPSSALYKKNILLLRGRFRPPTHVNFDMLKTGFNEFIEEESVDENNIITLFELTLKDLESDGEINTKDFLDRVELLGMLGQTVLISNYLKHYKVVEYLSKLNRKRKIGVILGIKTLDTLFDRAYYQNLDGGILEAFGLGFGGNVKLLIYPALDDDGNLRTCDNFKAPEDLKYLFKHLQLNGKLKGIEGVNKELLSIFSDDVLKMIKEDQEGWEKMLPYVVSTAIAEHGLFGSKKKVIFSPLSYIAD